VVGREGIHSQKLINIKIFLLFNISAKRNIIGSMTNKLLSIIIGGVLVLSVGTLVYVNKKPMVLPAEDGSAGALLDNSASGNTVTPVNSSTKATTNKFESDDDNDSEDDDDNGGVVTSPTVTTPAPVPTTTTTSGGGITLATIAKHSSRTSCWSAVNGSVYDLTSWIPNHPGGEQVILSMCGVDGSAGYNGQHGSSSKPARILGGFKIGTLAK